MGSIPETTARQPEGQSAENAAGLPSVGRNGVMPQPISGLLRQHATARGLSQGWRAALSVLAAALCLILPAVAQTTRPAWTTSRITGSPDPPPPLQTVRRFPHLQFEHPLLVRTDPTGERIWIAEQAGRILSFPDDNSVTVPHVFVDLKQSFSRLTPHAGAADVESVYGLAFHPRYPDVPFCWITYTLRDAQPGAHLEDGTRLARFRVISDDNGMPVCDVESERLLLTWPQGGHNGGCLEFGPDGCLYVSAGDGEVPNPPDPRDAGQDLSNLLSSILRIRVSVEDTQPAYSIPPDNPFVNLPQARGEIWAYGFRNPWKMSFAPDGELWAGDVGWELYEMVHRVRRGGNAGWSIMEGPQPVRPDAQRGPTEIIPAAIALPHTDAASVTGGYVYRGKKFPTLRGTYIFGDFETRRIWSARFEAQQLVSLTDLVSPSLRLVAMGEDAQGELLLLDYDAGTLHELQASPVSTGSASFPQRLSETGLFRDTPRLICETGVQEFQIQWPMWNDGARATRLVAVPGTQPIEVLPHPRRRDNWMLREKMRFPTDAVLARTVTLTDDNQADVRLETQLLHFDGHDWKGYAYVWNSEQTDAWLAPPEGTTLMLRDYGSFSDHTTWRIHARGECQRCHNQWVGGLLSFTQPQLTVDLSEQAHARAADPAAKTSTQWEQLHASGWLSGGQLGASDRTAKAHRFSSMPDLMETSRSGAEGGPAIREWEEWLAESPGETIEEWARTWLDVNCAHCHQNGAGGTATIDLRRDTRPQDTGLFDAKPSQGTFQLRHASLVTPGQPQSSVLLYRLAVTGRGHMPHIGSRAIDTTAVHLMAHWIQKSEPSPGTGESPAMGLPARDEALRDSSAALQWMLALDRNEVSAQDRAALLQAVLQAPAEIRGLFDRFQPESLRSQRREPILPAAILELNGDAELGAILFREPRLQCVTCHSLASTGGKVGPPLDDVGKRLSPDLLLESLLQPSRRIDPRYETWTAVTVKGQAISGLLIERTEQNITLRTAKGDDVMIPRNSVEEFHRQTVSLMPDQLINELDDMQIASLLAFLVQQTRPNIDPRTPSP